MSDNSQTRIARRLVATVVCLSLVLPGCADQADARIRVTGSVVEDLTTVAVPSLMLPVLDPFAVTSPSSSDTATPSWDEEPGDASAFVIARDAAPTAILPATQWQRVREVLARPGQHVRSGDVIARLDSAAASAAAAAAAADVLLAEAHVALVASRTADVSRGRTDVASETAELEATIADLEQQRTDVLSQLDAARASIPPSGSTEASIPPAIAASVARLEAAIAGLDTALQEARAGLEALREASTSLVESESALVWFKSLTEAVLEVRRATLELVEAQSEMATVTAPVDGVIVETAAVGEVLASGAPLVRLRPDRRPRVRTYLATEQVRVLQSSASAQVSLDSLPGQTFVALLATVGARNEYVPTTFATKIIHLSRGVEVIFEVYDATSLPPGTPVDLIIDPD